MKGWVKALIIIAVVIVVLIIGAVGVGIYFVQKYKGPLIAAAKDGGDFGRTTDNKGCVDETVARYKKDPGAMMSLMADVAFETSCLQSSRPTAGFCTDVPRQLEISKSVQWRIERCRSFDLEKDSYCQQLLTPVQQFCEHGPIKTSGNRNANSY